MLLDRIFRATNGWGEMTITNEVIEIRGGFGMRYRFPRLDVRHVVVGHWNFTWLRTFTVIATDGQPGRVSFAPTVWRWTLFSGDWRGLVEELLSRGWPVEFP